MSIPTDQLVDLQVFTKEAASIIRGDQSRLLDLAEIGDKLGAILSDEVALSRAAQLVVDLLGEEEISEVISLSHGAAELSSKVGENLPTVSGGLTVLLDLLISTGATAAARFDELGLSARDTLVVALAASHPNDQVDGLELRTPATDCLCS